MAVKGLIFIAPVVAVLFTFAGFIFFQIPRILRTRFTKQTFAQLKTGFSQLVHVDGEPDLCTL